jgi:hypothetical protein
MPDTNERMPRSHAYNVRTLREWTRKTHLENAKRLANREVYLANIERYRQMSEWDFEHPELREKILDCLREGIDQLPIPTLSMLKKVQHAS